MAIEPDQTLLHYRIVDKLGEGGMGVVWRAVDTTLDREVAIKVLPATVGDDSERLARFDREAKLLASLNHPNIAGIFGAHEDAGTRFIAMELVEGEDLAERLARGPIPVDEAVVMAREIATAFEAAHEAGVIHRDLKPANVKLTSEGRVKVLDFGLAKALAPDASSGSVDLTTSPTLTSAGTFAGMILGTAAYMSPEQAKGTAVDRRADIWSFGCVLYECLTGCGVFKAATVSEMLAEVLKTDPDWSALPPSTPPPIRRLLRRCLERNPKNRLHDIADARIVIEEVLAGDGDEPGTAPVAYRGPGLLPWAIGALALALGAIGAWLLKPTEPKIPTPDVRFEMMLPTGEQFSSNYNRVVTISPDSKWVAYISEALVLRPLSDNVTHEIPGTEGARSPAFSADSRQIAFWDTGHIKRVGVDGGVPIVVTALRQRPMGMHWSDDGFIYIGRADLGIWRVAQSGGELEPVLALEEGEFAHGPEPLPGGEWMLYSLSTGVRSWTEGKIVAQSLAGNERRVLVERGREVRYLPSGYLTYVQDSTLFAVAFDARRLQVTGAAVAMETDVHTSGDDETGAAGYDISDDGVLTYAPPSGMGALVARLSFFDAEGNNRTLPFAARRYNVARLSPDGDRIVAQISDIDGTHIWVMSVGREGMQRLTTEGRNVSPIWSPDGRWVYFASSRGGVTDIWRRPADLRSPAERVAEIDGAEMPASTDGSWLYYASMAPGNSDIGRVSLDGDAKVEVLVSSGADEISPRVSPDGRYVGFQSDETGRWDIHVMEIETGRRWIVSTVQGYFPQWSVDGSRIVYMAGASTAYTVEVELTPSFSAEKPELTFDIGRVGVGNVMDISADGGELLVAFAESEGAQDSRPRVHVVLNWADRVAERLRSEGGS